MLPKYNEVFDPKDVFLILHIFLFRFHEDINFVKRELHMLFFRPYDFHGYVLLVFMIKGFNHLSECSWTEVFQKLIAESELLVFFPQIGSIRVIFAYSCSDSNIENLLFICKLLLLVFGQ